MRANTPFSFSFWRGEILFETRGQTQFLVACGLSFLYHVMAELISQSTLI